MMATKAELNMQLQAWHAWAYEHGQGEQFSAHQLALYSGLEGQGQGVQLGRHGSCNICCMRLGISKRAKDRFVLLRVDVDLSDARVEAFVLHCPQSMAPLREGGIICRLDRHKPCRASVVDFLVKCTDPDWDTYMVHKTACTLVQCSHDDIPATYGT